ncbi:type IV secretory system conjugative DNA transfer VirD4/TraG family protein [Pseudonocardia sediminis]|uniref:Type IV secretory system conjugative DNA transfer VirD4/TraG family protein n=1 Tax=Pseudonocardia sediminis TaxID=1397368 RepID=A0A4Q7UUY2_PSEST|nr:type IV secretory system conjugative DNA transfer family protein [Pseudonocardia sediminis]RZT85575.1 type IV secretory system conjugative DNA transfer VirD4/TraG family protein [Pseudonocardia sediminis]
MAPLTLLGVISLAVLLNGNVWVASGTASLTGLGTWSIPLIESPILGALARGGSEAVLVPGAITSIFVLVIIVLTAVELGVAGLLGVVLLRNRGRRGDPRRSMLRASDLGELTGDAARSRARQLRPTAGAADSFDRGIRLLTIDRREVWMSWEDVALVIMGPRSNKTSAIAVPTVLSAPGLVVATSNKADLWALTAGMRGQAGPVWTFDPQRIAHAEQTWWWDPLRSIADADPTERVEAAARLAGHFVGTIGGERRDPFFHSAAEQVLTATLLAAAISGGTMRDVVAWLQPGRRDAIAALDQAGAETEAADLEATLSGADVTTKGIFQTARTATKSLTSERLMRWITPPDTWGDSLVVDPPNELDLWDLLAAGREGRATVQLLSKEGAGTAAPVVTALVDRILEIAELLAQASGGRLEPPVVAVLDEAANICPIRALPQLYSHYGSRGIQVLTMLQSYQQGVGVWGEQGTQALWSAATIKLVGAGVDDHAFLQKLSGLIGDHHVERISTSVDRTRTSRQYSEAREPVMPASALRAIPRDRAVLLSTGRRAGLGILHPWYREREHIDIGDYADIALAELRLAAAAALGTDNPVNRVAPSTPDDTAGPLPGDRP